MQNISFVSTWLVYFLTVVCMSPEITIIRSEVLTSTASALRDAQVSNLEDEGYISPDPSRWTMHVEVGFLYRKVRLVRNPDRKPLISDMIYALQSKS